MNLRDKLKAMNAQPAKAPAKPLSKPNEDCWQRSSVRPLSDFPDAFALSRDTLMLMQSDTLPQPLNPCRILYLDTETTGLSGGAGTVAFEVGIGRLTNDGFVIDQLVMRDYPQERYLLEHVSAALSRCDVICTFNGRTFDIPLLRDRFLMNRMDPSVLDKPHIDLLQLARRVWRLRLGRCNLTRLQEVILGYPRHDDLPGRDVPERFFRYLKTGDFSLLQDVLTHNGQDIASLCVLLSRMTQMYEQPENEHRQDVLSMGIALERQHHLPQARRCYKLCCSGQLRVQGKLRLAESYRKTGEKPEAAQLWREMISRGEGGITPYIELAKYEEHVLRDYSAALEHVRQAMALTAEPSLHKIFTVQQTQNALQYRYDRLKRRCSNQRS